MAWPLARRTVVVKLNLRLGIERELLARAVCAIAQGQVDPVCPVPRVQAQLRARQFGLPARRRRVELPLVDVLIARMAVLAVYTAR